MCWRGRAFANYNLFQHCEFISFCHAPDTHTNARSGSNFQLAAIFFEKSFVCALGGGDKSQNARSAALTKHSAALFPLHDLKIITTIRRRINLAFVTLCVLQVDYAFSARIWGPRCGAGCISHPSPWWTSAPLSLPHSPSLQHTHNIHKHMHAHITHTHIHIHTRYAPPLRCISTWWKPTPSRPALSASHLVAGSLSGLQTKNYIILVFQLTRSGISLLLSFVLKQLWGLEKICPADD